MRAVPTDLWIFLAGLVAGSVNAAAGGGTLLAFPVLIGVAHLSPLVANTTCTVGLLPGIIASTGGGRRGPAPRPRRGPGAPPPPPPPRGRWRGRGARPPARG